MSHTEDVMKQLAGLPVPGPGGDPVARGLVENLAITDDGVVSFTLQAGGLNAAAREALRQAAESAVRKLAWVTDVMIMLPPPSRENPLAPKASGLAGIRHILAVSSCKGGVGKSTIAVNLAYALARRGQRVGLFDADIYGPSLPTMVRLESPQLYQEDGLIPPLDYEGVKLMSFGFIPSASGAAIMRGPMVTQIINQLLTTTRWGDLDYLVLDLPPGTGDVQLTLTQIVSISAAVIVTTPQHLSFVDVVKGIQMFDKLKVPTIAVVENMSYYVCPGCSEKHHLFGQGARKRIVGEYGIRNSFEFPVDQQVSVSGDGGVPYIVSNPESGTSALFYRLAEAVVEEINALGQSSKQRPTVSYHPSSGIELQLGDQRHGYIVPATLRRTCRCATCVEEFSGKQLLRPEDVPENVYPVRMQPMGNYAIAIQWSDGHTSSIYPYDMLKEMAGLAS